MNLMNMIIIMFVAGMLSTMNIFAVSPKHVRLHLNDLYMVLLMIGWMVLLTGIFDHVQNANTIVIFSILFIAFVIYLIRTQTFIDDKQFLNGMVSHHSYALLMAQRIKEKTKNPEIIKLANNIIKAQTEEIQLMDNLLKTRR